MSTVGKYDQLADRFAEREYADPEGYADRRAHTIARLGPPLEPGDSVLDLCCADGIMARPLVALGLRYAGVDASAEMLDAARKRNPGLPFSAGLMEGYEPPEPVDATICLRSFYLADDRVAFFRRVGSYTRKKLVFDFQNTSFPAGEIERDLRAAGFTRIELRPFFMPQQRALPRVALPLVSGLERSGPIGLALSRRHGVVFCSATSLPART
jgi:SAM-dependent methyltransferase